MTNSREKGIRGEREWASFCRGEGYDCRRGKQYCGIEGNADVVGLNGLYVEVKRRQLKTLEGWLHKAFLESLRAGNGEMPIVAHRGDCEDWKVTLYAEHFFRIYREWDAGQDYKGAGGMGDHGTIEDGEEDEMEEDKP